MVNCCSVNSRLRKINSLTITVLIIAGCIFSWQVTGNENNYSNWFDGSYQILSLATNLSDLDARNIYNQQISNPSSAQMLIDLFVSDLYNSLMKSEIHSMSYIFQVLNERIKAYGLMITVFVKKLPIYLNEVFLPMFRKLQLILILFGIIILFTGKIFPTSCAHLFYIPKPSLTPLVLRC